MSDLQTLTTDVQTLAQIVSDAMNSISVLTGLWQEKKIIDELVLGGMAMTDAIAYVERLKKNERPWLDDAANLAAYQSVQKV